ncbi:MAG: HDOD domain-containing protein [Acidimicrobiia bacterium]|nr:HDOD domain-containing protein [Acidimicrobiia bacterium]
MTASTATDSLTEELRLLPMREAVASHLLSLINDEASAEAVGRAAATDPSLSARLLRMANSAYFGLPGRVSSIHRAVVVLGMSVVRSIAVSALAGLFADRTRSMPPDFWSHSIATAAGSELVAGSARVPPGDAFSAGLLHDLGWALLWRRDPETCKAIVGATRGDSAASVAAEREAFGIAHPEAGAIALELWGLPPELVQAIRNHHDEEGTLPLARCLVGGEALVRVLDTRAHLGTRPLEPELRRPLQAVGLGPLTLPATVTRLRNKIDGLSSFLAALG